MRCLLIETKDKRKFFTHEKNFVQLIEFSKAFNAQISTVKLEEGTILELEELAPAICDPSYKKSDVQYKILETKLSKENRSRKDILKAATLIKKYVESKFFTRETVSIKELQKKFKKYEFTDAAMRNHIKKIMLDLENKGFRFEKIAVGTYKAI